MQKNKRYKRKSRKKVLETVLSFLRRKSNKDNRLEKIKQELLNANLPIEFLVNWLIDILFSASYSRLS